jgi:hypothetical protein
VRLAIRTSRRKRNQSLLSAPDLLAPPSPRLGEGVLPAFDRVSRQHLM